MCERYSTFSFIILYITIVFGHAQAKYQVNAFDTLIQSQTLWLGFDSTVALF
jgi:hypothetical protein